MRVLGTNEAVNRLRTEGFKLTKSRLESLLSTGRVQSPPLVGTSRAWTEERLEDVRRVLVALDGTPQQQEGGNL